MHAIPKYLVRKLSWDNTVMLVICFEGNDIVIVRRSKTCDMGDLFLNIMKQSNPADILIHYLNVPPDECIQFYYVYHGSFNRPVHHFRVCDLNQQAMLSK